MNFTQFDDVYIILFTIYHYISSEIFSVIFLNPPIGGPPPLQLIDDTNTDFSGFPYVF